MIGERLKRLRESKGLSQRQLGKAIGISGVQIGRYENGENNGGEEVLLKLASYFGVGPTYLSGKSDDPDRNNNTPLEWEALFIEMEAQGLSPDEVRQATNIYRAILETQKREG